MSDWIGCYDENWKGVIVEEAFSHPAKFSRALIARMFAHAKEEGWVVPGSTVLDPFGGVALGALEAMRLGCHWVGCELEPKFYDLGNKNIAYWNARFRHLPGWGTARLVQGDSRRLGEVLRRQVDCCVSSPPFLSTEISGSDTAARAGLQVDGSPRGGRFHFEYGDSPGQLGAMKEGSFDSVMSSPPYVSSLLQGEARDTKRMVEREQRYLENHPELAGKRPELTVYGSTEGQLGTMKEDNFDLTVSSPPFMDARQDTTRPRPPASMDGDLADKDGRLHRLGACEYGATDGQLAAMRAGEYDLVASSPPYEGSTVVDGRAVTDAATHTRPIGEMKDVKHGYGETQGQLSSEQGPTFWSAARAIVEQCYLLLKPGGVAMWVVKGFVRKGKLVDFPHQWQSLCESVGFVALHEHHAMLTTELDEQFALDGTSVRRTVERKSFFRRLAEKKGSPKIDYETVLCMRKEEAQVS